MNRVFKMQLVQFRKKTSDVIAAFDKLPKSLQMDGLDVLQDLVNCIMKTITSGR